MTIDDTGEAVKRQILSAAEARGAAAERERIRRELIAALDSHFQGSIAAETEAVGSTKRHGERRIRQALSLLRLDVLRICQPEP